MAKTTPPKRLLLHSDKQEPYLFNGSPQLLLSLVYFLWIKQFIAQSFTATVGCWAKVKSPILILLTKSDLIFPDLLIFSVSEGGWQRWSRTLLLHGGDVCLLNVCCCLLHFLKVVGFLAFIVHASLMVKWIGCLLPDQSVCSSYKTPDQEKLETLYTYDESNLFPMLCSCNTPVLLLTSSIDRCFHSYTHLSPYLSSFISSQSLYLLFSLHFRLVFQSSILASYHLTMLICWGAAFWNTDMLS